MVNVLFRILKRCQNAFAHNFDLTRFDLLHVLVCLELSKQALCLSIVINIDKFNSKVSFEIRYISRFENMFVTQTILSVFYCH